MKALILEEPGRLSYRDIPVPTPGPGEVLLKVEATTTCGTDVKAFLRGHPAIPMPGQLGHEYSGTVVAVGEGAKFRVGDAVMGVHSAPCQACFWCKRDQENLCESVIPTMILGSYAPYLLVTKRISDLNLFPKPDSLSFEQASLLEPLSCVAQGFQVLKVRPDDRVLVIGPGAIGLMFAAAFRLQGIEDVLLAGRTPARLAIGEELGVRTSLLNDVRSKFDIVIECTGTVEIWERSIDFAERGSTVMLFGGCPSGTRASFDTRTVHYDQISLLSPFHFGTAAVRQAREWLIDPRFDLSPLISGRRLLDDAAGVFRDLREGKGIKYVFQP
ncbi:MAG: zinc-dependent alcohol dehydrogenase [Fimbriimonas sp.]